MRRALPNDPIEPVSAPVSTGGQTGGGSFEAFVHNQNFLATVMHPDRPEPNTGVHVPVWLSPKLARAVLSKHGRTGHAIPHPNIDIRKLDR